jgi:hypothetical protein
MFAAVLLLLLLAAVHSLHCTTLLPSLPFTGTKPRKQRRHTNVSLLSNMRVVQRLGVQAGI